MTSFPIMLDLAGRPVVVVGAGNVGLRRVKSLLQAGACVTLVSPDAQLGPPAEGVTVMAQAYTADSLKGASLVFACTDDHDLNARIAQDAREAGVLVNVADCPENCDFLMPAAVVDGDVVVAVGTSGSAPSLAGSLRDLLAAALPERVGEFAAELGRLRRELVGRVPDAARRADVLRELSGRDAIEEFLRDGPGALRAHLDSIIGAE